MLLGFSVIPRVIWILIFPPRIESDYALYVRMGMTYARTGRPETDPYMLSVATGAVPYSVLTGLLMRLFGEDASTLVWAAEILHICNILLLYLLARNMTAAPRAFFAAAVFALLPENIFYSHLPGSEAPALFTLLLGLILPAEARKKPGRRALPLYFLGGAALVFSACIRPSAWAALAASGILILTVPRDRKGAAPLLSRRALSLLALLLGAALVFGGYKALQNTLFPDEKPVSGIGWAVYEGLDLESGGRWTEEKSARMVQVINAYPAAEAERIFLTEGLARYRSYTFGEKIRLFLRKGGALWYDSRYAVFSAEGSAAEYRLNAWCGDTWRLCLAAFIFCLLYRTFHAPGRAVRRAAALPLITILLTVLWHGIGTSIGRYHYMLIPFVLLAAAILLPGKWELQRPWYPGETGRRFRPTEG